VRRQVAPRLTTRARPAGMEARVAIALDRRQTTGANASKRRCTVFYDGLKAAREKV